MESRVDIILNKINEFRQPPYRGYELFFISYMWGMVLAELKESIFGPIAQEYAEQGATTELTAEAEAKEIAEL